MIVATGTSLSFLSSSFLSSGFASARASASGPCSTAAICSYGGFRFPIYFVQGERMRKGRKRKGKEVESNLSGGAGRLSFLNN